MYLVKVTYTDGRPSKSEWIENPKKIDYFKLFEINDSLWDKETRSILTNKLLTEIAQLPPRVVTLVSSGINVIGNHPVYVMGENIISDESEAEHTEHLQLKTSQFLIPVHQTSPSHLMEKASKYISLLPGITEPLFYFSLFAVVKPFVEQLQIHCGFLLALIAPSGQLKTTLARLYCLWLKSADSQEIAMHSSMRTQHILDLINTMSGQNILIDDLRKSRDANIRRRQESRLDDISRYINSNFNCANIILTGETMENMGIFSCIDRIYQLKMPVLDADQIQKLQKDLTAIGTNAMPGIALAFTKVLMAHYNDVLTDIQYFYDENKFDGFHDNSYSTRTARHAMFILLTEFLFNKYFCSMQSEKIYLNFKEKLDSALNAQTRKQIDELLEMHFLESQRDYIWDFYNIINIQKRIRICSDKKQYDPTNTVFMKEDRMCLSSVVLKNIFFDYYQRFIPTSDIINQFHNKGILEEEASAKGFQKNINGQKLYVVNMKILIRYLLQYNYPVSAQMKKRYLEEDQPTHT